MRPSKVRKLSGKNRGRGAQPSKNIRLIDLATGLCDGDKAAALKWLETPIPALGNRRPVDIARTKRGTNEVAKLIRRIEHGIVC